MQEEKLNTYKNKLLEEKSRLEKELGALGTKETADNYETKFDDYGRNEEDNAEEVEEYSTKLGITETLEKNLVDVNDALEKIEKGAYGICENCSAEISPERLDAYPAAKKCMGCSANEQA